MALERSDENLIDPQVAVLTLTTGGFTITRALRTGGYGLVFAYRYDEFGVKHKYCFAFFNSVPEPAEINSAEIPARHDQAKLVIVSPSESPEKAHVEWNRFLNLFGGPVHSSSPLEQSFAGHLTKLGLNALPAGLQGRSDDLFELYVHKALEFMFGCRVHRYGQERRFEARPDGIILQDGLFSALYDTKAYAGGYDVTLDSLRQFGSYIAEFRRRYGSFFQLNAFIVISGKFLHSPKTWEARSRQLLEETQTPLAFLTARSLAEIVQLLSAYPSARRSINWRKIFVNTVIDPAKVQAELALIDKDRIVTKKKG